jgi:hypothetical protein
LTPRTPKACCKCNTGDFNGSFNHSSSRGRLRMRAGGRATRSLPSLSLWGRPGQAGAAACRRCSSSLPWWIAIAWPPAEGLILLARSVARERRGRRRPCCLPVAWKGERGGKAAVFEDGPREYVTG